MHSNIGVQSLPVPVVQCHLENEAVSRRALFKHCVYKQAFPLWMAPDRHQC